MAVTYYLSATNSDLSGGADFSAALALATGTPGSRSTSVGAGATDVNMAWTPSGDPGTRGATGNYSIEVNVTSGSTAIMIAVQIHRVNSAGTVQASSSTTAEQQATAGVKTFTLSSVDLGTWASGDRLRVDYRCRSTAAHGNTTITIGTDSTDEEHSTPFTAAGPDLVDKSDSDSRTLSEFAALAGASTDTGTETETAALTAVSENRTDAFTGADKRTQIAILYASPATGTLAETTDLNTGGAEEVSKSDSDSATTAELEEVVISDAGSEGTLADTVASLTAVGTSSDTATLTDIPALSADGSDTGTEAETHALTATATATETGTQAEAPFITATTADADTASLTDNGVASAFSDVAKSGDEAGTLADTGALTAVAENRSDTQSADEAALVAATLGHSETGTATDAGDLSPAIAGIETATQTDLASITATLTASDAGGEVEDSTIAQQSTTPTAADSASLSETATLSEVIIGAALPESNALVAFGSIEAKLRNPRVLPRETVRDEDYGRVMEYATLDVTPIEPRLVASVRMPWEDDLEDEDALILALIS